EKSRGSWQPAALLYCRQSWRNTAMIGSLTLSEYPGDIVRLSCPKCGRAGQYRKQNLIERYGADTRLPTCGREKHNAGTAECTMPAWCVTLIWSGAEQSD